MPGILELRSVSKHFGAIHALNEVDLTLEEGEVLGLMGDNGAGKSTLVKVIAGNFPPTHGEIRLGRGAGAFPQAGRGAGEGRSRSSIRTSRSATISPPPPTCSSGARSSAASAPFACSTTRRWRKHAGALFTELKSETRPRDLVRQMSGGQRQAVAIARTRLSKARIVLMDEPTAAISVRQVAEVLDLIRRLKDSGMAIVLISHRMPDVFAVCDRVMVMRRGRKVADKAIKATSPEEVTGLITGAIHAA